MPRKRSGQGGSSRREEPKPSFSSRKVGGKESLMDIASSTLQRLEKGSYRANDVDYDLSKAVKEMNENTFCFAADSELSKWHSAAPTFDEDKARPEVKITVTECSTLVGARALKETLVSEEEEGARIGVLNFASAKNPGGGFMTGAQAQEESIARSSTIYPSLKSTEGQKFYLPHKKDPKKGYYSHAMIYSPHVLLIRADNGDWLSPVEVDMVTSCAVNAGVVRRYLREKQSEDESDLEAAMKERMARVLYLFEKQGVRNLVLGSFGTGVFRNRVELVAGVWKQLLVGKDARFKHSFDRVEFSILGNATYNTFKTTFSSGIGVRQGKL